MQGWYRKLPRTFNTVSPNDCFYLTTVQYRKPENWDCLQFVTWVDLCKPYNQSTELIYLSSVTSLWLHPTSSLTISKSRWLKIVLHTDFVTSRVLNRILCYVTFFSHPIVSWDLSMLFGLSIVHFFPLLLVVFYGMCIPKVI